MYQNGITQGNGFQDAQELREWLESAIGSTSIAYRIEGLDAKGVYPRVLTAAAVECPNGDIGWAIGHCIDLDDSLLVGTRNFVHDDCPKTVFLKMPAAARCFAAEVN